MNHNAELSEQSAGAANYHSGIRGAARAYWLDAVDYFQFDDMMQSAIRLGIPKAWYEGAAACGIKPSELSPEERDELRAALYNETTRVGGFAIFIEEHSKAKGGKWGTVAARADVWVNRYTDVVNHAKVMACADQKLEWVLHGAFVTKEPCNTCANKLNGKVKRASYWQRVDVRPQNPPNWALDCEGWKCGCALSLTDKPLSRGPLPRLP